VRIAGGSTLGSGNRQLSRWQLRTLNPIRFNPNIFELLFDVFELKRKINT
jgi:hypothetical protein